MLCLPKRKHAKSNIKGISGVQAIDVTWEFVNHVKGMLYDTDGCVFMMRASVGEHKKGQGPSHESPVDKNRQQLD